MGGFLGGWFGGPVRRMVPAYQPPLFDGEDARAVQSLRGGVQKEFIYFMLSSNTTTTGGESFDMPQRMI